MQITLAQDDGFVPALNTALLADLSDISVQGVNSQINLAMRDQEGVLIAGLSAVTSYGWLHINMLWVAQAHRNGGLGRCLMQDAVARSVKQQCHAAWLDTSNPHAKAFYLALGFEVFATLDNTPNATPPNHTRWFMRQIFAPVPK